MPPGHAGGVSGIDILPYALVAAVVAASLLAIVLIGLEAWVVLAVAVPPAILYVLYDRRAKRRHE